MRVRASYVEGKVIERASRGAGFARAELLSCAIIVMVVTVVGYPPIREAFGSTDVVTAAQLVAEDLRRAVALASERGTPVRVEFDAEALEVRLRDRRFGTVLHARRVGPGTDFPTASATASGSVDVYPNHLASGPLVITVVTPERAERVIMTRATEVRIEEM
jgi:hypothetical protein